MTFTAGTSFTPQRLVSVADDLALRTLARLTRAYFESPQSLVSVALDLALRTVARLARAYFESPQSLVSVALDLALRTLARLTRARPVGPRSRRQGHPRRAGRRLPSRQRALCRNSNDAR